jgi:hypothetical protein
MSYHFIELNMISSVGVLRLRSGLQGESIILYFTLPLLTPHRYTTVCGVDDTSRFDDNGAVVEAKTGAKVNTPKGTLNQSQNA